MTMIGCDCGYSWKQGTLICRKCGRRVSVIGERLRNPMWVHSLTGPPVLEAEQTKADMAEAAALIETLTTKLEAEKERADALTTEIPTLIRRATREADAARVKAERAAYEDAGRAATDRFDVPPEHEANPNAFHLGWEMCAREIAGSIAAKRLALGETP